MPEPLKFVVVAEAHADFRAASILSDRVCVDQIEWLEAHLLDAHRVWVSGIDRENYVKWSQIKRVYFSRGRRVHGQWGGYQSSDADTARKALLFVQEEVANAKAVLLIRDSDGEMERLDGLRQAREWHGAKWEFAVVIGFAHTMRECWILAAIDHNHEVFAPNVAKLCQHLGFNPCAESHRLTAQDKESKKSPKRVLKQLVDSAEAEERLLREAPLDRLRKNGEQNGLRDFLAEIKSHIAPLMQRA